MGVPWYAAHLMLGGGFYGRLALPNKRSVNRNSPEALRRALDKPKHWERKKGRKRKAGQK